MPLLFALVLCGPLSAKEPDEIDEVLTSTEVLYGEYAAPNGQVEADAYARKLVQAVKDAAAERDLSLENVVVYVHHQGEAIPTEVRWMLDTLGAHRIPFEVVRWHKDLRRISKRKRARIDSQMRSSELLAELKEDPSLPSWVDEPVAASLWSRFQLGLRQFFKMPQGFWVTAIPYVDQITGFRRPVAEQVSDLLVSSILAGASATAAFLEIQKKFPGDPSVSIAGAVITAALWRVIFGYTNRANNRLHNSASSYRHDIGRVQPALRWSLLTMFLHSFCASYTFQAVLRGSENVTADLLWHTAKTSFIGGFVKILPTRLLAGAEGRVSTWKLCFANWTMQFLLESLKYSTLVEGSNLKTYAYWALGVAGVAEILGRHFFSKAKANTVKAYWAAFKKRIRKDWENILGIFGLERDDEEPYSAPIGDQPLFRTQIRIGCATRIAA